VSRFADSSAVRRVEFGACECPDTPHSGDFAEIRADLSDSELAVLFDLPKDQEGAARAVAPFIVRWNLLGPDGSDWPPTPEALYLLKRETMQALGDALADVMRENVTLPNRSGARSRASSRASASRTPSPIQKPGT
jgi:hypothetical protein